MREGDQWVKEKSDRERDRERGRRSEKTEKRRKAVSYFVLTNDVEVKLMKDPRIGGWQGCCQTMERWRGK